MQHAYARTDALMTREVDGELVVHDTIADTWHTLDAVSTAVFRAADGTRDLAAIAAHAGLTEAQTSDALLALAQADLVSLPAGITRRSLVKRAAVLGGGAAVVGVLSLQSPTAAAAASGGGGGGTGVAPGSLRLFTTDAPDGTPDPLVEVGFSESGPYSPALAYNNSAYNKLAGTGFVGAEDGVPTTYFLRAPFTLPPGYAVVGVSGRVRADNGVILRATNGTEIGRQNTTESQDNFNGNADLVVNYSGGDGFRIGNNNLLFEVSNAGNGVNPYGLDFDLTVTYS